MREERPYRAALDADAAATQLRSGARAGRFDDRAVEAVLKAAGHARVARSGADPDLSAREIEVLRLLARGLSNKEMGQRLFIAAKTVGHHVSAVLRKLGEPTRARVVAAATRQGLIPAADGPT